eukprot:XP_011456411.1 PREDICTED: mucin-1-like [Crassostrea gigas]
MLVVVVMAETKLQSDIGAGLRCSSAASLPECSSSSSSSRQNRGRKRECCRLRSERKGQPKRKGDSSTGSARPPAVGQKQHQKKIQTPSSVYFPNRPSTRTGKPVAGGFFASGSPLCRYAGARGFFSFSSASPSPNPSPSPSPSPNPNSNSNSNSNSNPSPSPSPSPNPNPNNPNSA